MAVRSRVNRGQGAEEPTAPQAGEAAVVWRQLLLVGGIALSCRIVLLILYHRVSFDLTDYDRLATNLLSGNGFSLSVQEPYLPSVRRPPGYPMLLSGIYALFGVHNFTAALIVQECLDSGIAVITYLIGRRWTGEPRVASLAGLLYAIHPLPGYSAATLQSETLFTLLLAGSVLLLMNGSRRKRLASFVWGGVLLGAAVLTRVVPFLFGLFFLAGSSFFHRRRLADLRRPVVYCLVPALIVALWTTRNYLALGVMIPVHAQGVGLFYMATMGYDSQLDETAHYALVRSDPLIIAMERASTGQEIREAERAVLVRAVENIKADPLRYLVSRATTYPRLFLNSGNYLFAAPVSFGRAFSEGRWGTLVLKVLLLLVLSALPVAAAMFTLLHRRFWDYQGFILASYPLYTAAFFLPMWIEQPRFSVPTYPFLLTLAAKGFHDVSLRFKGLAPR